MIDKDASFLRIEFWVFAFEGCEFVLVAGFEFVAVLLDPEEGDGDYEGEDDDEVDVLVALDLEDLVGERGLLEF